MKKLSIDRNQLKYIAIITMIIDHIKVISTGTTAFICGNIIGRISMPIFLYLFVDGFYKTKHPWKHVRDLLIFGLLSEFIYDLYFHDSILEFSNQNVLLTWTFCYIFLMVIRKVQDFKIKDKFRCITIYLTLTYIFALLSEILRLDYSIFAVVIVFLIYVTKPLLHERLFNNILIIVMTTVIESVIYLTLGCLLAIPIISIYNENKKCKYNKVIKYGFYIIYPLHLVVLYIIKRCLF